MIIKPLFGTANQAITITLAALAASETVGRESTVVDNASDLYDDALLFLVFETGTVSGNKQVFLFVYASVDGGSTYTEGVTGADAGFTRKNPGLLIPLRVIPAVTSAFVHKCGPYSVASAFGGVLPEKWGIVVCNDTGAAFSGTAGNNKAFYQGVQAQGV